MPRAYSGDPAVDRSLRHSVRDAAAYSAMSGAGETYIAAFAVFLKANTHQVALLASLPPLLGSFAQLLSAWLGQRTGLRKPLILGGVTVQALMWLPLAALPLLFPAHALPLLIACVILYHAAGHFALPQWSSMMGDLVPENMRGRFFGARTRVASITAFLALVTGGLILDHFDGHSATVIGFVTIFVIAALARLISLHHLSRMHDPPRGAALAALPTPRQTLRHLRHSAFARFSLFYAAMQFAVAIASPFFTVYMLRELELSYLSFMTISATVVLTQFFTLNLWGRISDRFGNRLILAATGIMLPVLPSLWLYSTDAGYLIAIQIAGGFAWAGFSLSAGNFIYDLVPSPKRATHIAYHNTLASAAVFGGALLGGYLAAVLPTRFEVAGHVFTWHSALFGVFIASALARAAVALIFIPHLREVREVPPMPVSGLIFRVSGIQALAGLIFDIMLPRQRKPGINEAEKNMARGAPISSAPHTGLRRKEESENFYK